MKKLAIAVLVATVAILFSFSFSNDYGAVVGDNLQTIATSSF